MDSGSDCKHFFENSSKPTNYSTDVTRIKTFIENNLKSDRRIVLVTVS